MRLKFHINVQQGLKKTPEWAVRCIILLGYHHIHISFLRYKFLILDVIILFEIDLEALKTTLLPLAKMGGM